MGCTTVWQLSNPPGHGLAYISPGYAWWNGWYYAPYAPSDVGCAIQGLQQYFDYAELAVSLEPHLAGGGAPPDYPTLAAGIQPELDYAALAVSLEPFLDIPPATPWTGTVLPSYEWLVVVAFLFALVAWRLEDRGYPFLPLVYFLAVLAAGTEEIFFLLTVLLGFGYVLRGLTAYVQ